MDKKVKMCPDRKVTQVHPALTYVDGDTTIEYFTECLQEKCIAYRDGNCKKYNNHVFYQGE